MKKSVEIFKVQLKILKSVALKSKFKVIKTLYTQSWKIQNLNMILSGVG